VIATSRTALLALSLALVAAAAGCGTGSSSDKAGGQEQQTTVLRMANAIGGTDELGPFLGEVTRLSRGELRIDVRNSWRLGRVDYETALIRDVRAGKADIGWVGARAWASLGVTSFDALQAPFLIDTYGLEQEVVRSPMVAQMLARLGALGVVPIGVLPGPLRETLGRAPLRSRADFAGKSIGVQRSWVATATMRTLGAKPTSFPTQGEIGAFDGIEQQVTSIDGNHYDAVARYVTGNLKLWPRPLVLFMNRAAFDRLPKAQQRLLREAVRDAVAPTARLLVAREAESAGNLCRRGAIFVSSSSAELAELGTAVRPVYAELEREPETRAFIQRIQALKRARPDAPAPADTTCKPGAGAGTSARGSQLIAGTYTATVTHTELLEHPAFESGEDNRGNYGSYRLHFAKGRWTVENLSAHGSVGGTYSIDGTTITLRPSGTGEIFVYRWSLYRDALTFTKVSAGPTWLVVHPWHRAG
jgi:TRAP-type C4-dicarboxylate transport system substrate-binding protein